ncbi:MAG: GGDEF domain-containing protein [Planctomycetaceae bacterium]
MDNPPLINDVLIMLSAIGSAVAGVLCGWQIRSASLRNSAEMAPDDHVGIASLDLPEQPRQLGDAFDGDGATTVIATESAGEGNRAVALAAPDWTATAGGSETEVANELSPVLSPSEICEVAERLIQMADRITADVDAHDAELDKVNHALNADNSVNLESVMAAVEKLVAVNEVMQSQLRESRDRIVEQAREIETAEHRANTDALTRVGNRRAFDHELAEWTGDTPGVLALIDIDHFKRFNDEHGHRAGDEVLRAVAGVLRSHLEGQCLVARYGGEEFGLVFSDRRLEDVLDLIESARRAIAEHGTMFSGKQLHVTCSLGVTRMLAGEPSADCIQRADDALYLSKDAGRDCAHCIDSLEIGKRRPAFRLQLNDQAARRKSGDADQATDPSAKPKKLLSPSIPSMRCAINHAIFNRIPNREALGDSYRELLVRLAKSPVKLSVIALSISDPEQPVEASHQPAGATRFSKLFDVTQAFCRTVDRIGYLNENTLLICMPGTEGDRALNRSKQLKAVVATQLQIAASEFSVGVACGMVGDTFELLVRRAVEQANG